MATILLQTAGAVLGGFLGPVGSAIGSAVGAMAGYSIDRALINGTRRIEGPRLTGARPFTAEEGVAVPRIYSSARVGGTLIWATRFEETRTTTRQGAKGGPRVTEYSYFANVAFAVCEGEIAGIRRIWADGREIDQTGVQLRVYRGTKNQPVDPLIAARQGTGNAPAYRGLAYVVIERFALNDYGNRIPQFQFEVLRPVGSFGSKVKAVALIPGATEYGLSPVPVTRRKRPGETESVNRNVLHAGTDIEASLDELQMLFPNLEHVALVATWFGDDLRAGHCRIRPGVTDRNGGYSQDWQVAGVSRGQAMQVSRVNGHAAYGGTPSDRSVRDAIAAIKARGLKVTLYPFIMMDVPGDNELPDPYGGAKQAAYPWRGRITCFPRSADKTAAARTQVQAFYGNGNDWGYRRFVLHFARLAASAGGVDAFLIGTELRGLTALRDQANAFPFVEALCGLAAEVRAIVGAGTALTYGADWSEYFGYQPGDGSGDVFFHLDSLWAHPAIDAVGIDNYMPLSDWRDADYSALNPDGFASPYDVEGMRRAIAGGEGFDWYYASTEARLARKRTPITDGAYGKPWVYRYKDIANWWSRPHRDRVAGVEKASATAWQPRSKPIWFTELGCPAIDKGPNQPNVFPDPKSVENASPYFSNGGRSDAAQKRFLNAHLDHWAQGGGNPVSPIYGGQMVDPERIYLWAWDARPVPAFPQRSDLWADGANWHCGHWLNGRAGNPEIGDLINAILADHGIEPADVSGVEGTVTGYVISDPTTARQALEPLIDMFGLGVRQDARGLSFRQETALPEEPTVIEEMVSEEGSAVIETVRSGDQDMPAEAILEFRDPFAEYQTISVRSRLLGAKGSRQHTISFPGVLEAGQGKSLLEERMNRLAGGREVVSFAVVQPDEKIVPGAVIRVPASGSNADFIVTEIEDGLTRKVSARQVVRSLPAPWGPGERASKAIPIIVAGQPLALFLDLPMNGAGASEDQFRAALWRKPWRTQNVFVSPEDTGFEYRGSLGRPANIGVLREALGAGGEGRIQRAGAMIVELFGGEAASISRLQLLNGGNAAAVRSVSGVWEVVQFETAEEVEPDVWRLRGLLRGQVGTGDAAASGAPAGAYFVMLDSAVEPAGLRATEAGLELNWRAGAAGADFSDANFATSKEIGGVRAKLPLSPVHLRMREAAGGFEFSWIRRGRIDADSWMPNEIALGEESERYRIEVGTVDGVVRRIAESAMPSWVYGAAQMAADFGALPSEVLVTVRQLSAAVGWGLPARRVFKIENGR